MASLLGKEIFIVDQFSTSDNFLTQLTFGSIKGGFWVIFVNMQTFSNTVLSIMAQQVYFFSTSFKLKLLKDKYDKKCISKWRNQIKICFIYL